MFAVEELRLHSPESTALLQVIRRIGEESSDPAIGLWLKHVPDQATING